MEYEEFLKSKNIEHGMSGFNDIPELNNQLMDFQSDIVKWSLKKGKACIFADCGMGKTFMQLEWARCVSEKTNAPVLILAPLAVSDQTIREGNKFGIHVEHLRSDVWDKGIYITNYERLHKYDIHQFKGLVLDESSILKSYTGKYRTEIIEESQSIPYRLACTATPAPNDFMELGNHAEFVNAMTRTEMLSMFFVHDGGETQKWRLKGHAENEFWKWVASWAVMIRKPSDLGYDDGNYILPELTVNQVTVHSDKPTEGFLFPMEAQGLQERQKARKTTMMERVNACAEMVNNSDETWIIWCGLNSESEELRRAIHGSVEVKGSDSDEHKKKSLLGFANGEIHVLISKVSIAGFGMNFQICHNMAFVGLSDSYEQYYQAVRRCWRFGQKKPVNVNIITSDREGAVVKNVMRKEADAVRMQEEMVQHMHLINERNIRGTTRTITEYHAEIKIQLPSWLK